jgi:hypothetical protein
MAKHTTYPKFSYRGLLDFEIQQIYVFSFLFFMQKLSGQTMDMLYKSYRVFHQEYNKIGFAYFWFFKNFLRILQDSAERVHYWSCGFTPWSLETFDSLQMCPWFTQNTLERNQSLQLGPRAREAARPAGLRRVWRRSRPGRWRGSTTCSPRTC